MIVRYAIGELTKTYELTIHLREKRKKIVLSIEHHFLFLQKLDKWKRREEKKKKRKCILFFLEDTNTCRKEECVGDFPFFPLR